MNAWIGVDLDGTLAEYHGWPQDGSIGRPVPAMVGRVKEWIAEGKLVKVFTARIWPIGSVFENDPVYRDRRADAIKQYGQILEWCSEHIGTSLGITCCKDYGMAEFWDDRAVQVIPNTGIRADGPRP